jgi:hypothetical protein
MEIGDWIKQKSRAEDSASSICPALKRRKDEIAPRRQIKFSLLFSDGMSLLDASQLDRDFSQAAKNDSSRGSSMRPVCVKTKLAREI